MRVRIIKKFESNVKGETNIVGKVIEVHEADEIKKPTYIRYIREKDNSIEWVPKDCVKPAPEGDEELEWKCEMIEWGEISCPFRHNKFLMTYYPKGSRPYDTVTNPFIDDDGEIYYYQFDQDEGGWKDDTFVIGEAEEYDNIEEVLFY